jgi:hypothetical protein
MKTATSTSAKSAAKKTVAVTTAAKKTVAPVKKHSGFEKGTGCYECGVCGKKTRSTGNGDNENAKLCVECWEKAGDENAVMDGLMTQADFNARYGVNENFLNEGKPEAADETTTHDVEPVAPDATPETLPATPVPTPAAELPEVALVAPKAAKEKLTLPKLRRVGDIKNVLKAGGSVIRENGLYRLLLADGQKQPVSKRRCIALIAKKLVVPTETGWALAPEAPKEEKK